MVSPVTGPTTDGGLALLPRLAFWAAAPSTPGRRQVTAALDAATPLITLIVSGSKPNEVLQSFPESSEEVGISPAHLRNTPDTTTCVAVARIFTVDVRGRRTAADSLDTNSLM